MCAAQGRGLRAGWTFLALFLGLVGIFYWVPGTIAVKGPMPYPLALLAGALFYGYEALGFLAVAGSVRWAQRRGGAFAAACAAALAMLVWEGACFHVYSWSWGAPLGGVPWLARSAAFLGSHGLAAALWAGGAWTGAELAAGHGPRRVWPAPLLLLLLLGCGAGAGASCPGGRCASWTWS